MADITKCNGGQCPIKEKCYRYTAQADDYQSWFFSPPFEVDMENKTFKCDMYWGEQQDLILGQLKNITSGLF